MSQLEQLIKAVDSNKVHQIRCGDHRFIDITIVQSQGRFFVRQYKFGKRSWYHAFVANPSVDGEPNGALKADGLEVEIVGRVPSDLDTVNPSVDKAYKKLLGLIYPIMSLFFDRKKHRASTLELIPIFAE